MNKYLIIGAMVFATVTSYDTLAAGKNTKRPVPSNKADIIALKASLILWDLNTLPV